MNEYPVACKNTYLYVSQEEYFLEYLPLRFRGRSLKTSTENKTLK